MDRSRPEAQINAVLRTKGRVCNDQQSIALDDGERRKRGSQHDFTLFMNDLQKRLPRPEEEIEDESCTFEIEDERMDSAARLQKLSCVVNEQQKVYNNIIHIVKMGDKMTPNKMIPNEDPVTPSSSSRGPRFQRSPMPRPSSAGAIAAKPSVTREVNAEVVAESFQYQQACLERFQDGRKAVFARKLKKHDNLDASLDAAEIRHAKQIKDKLLEQKKKICSTQQKHADQKGQFRELQRSQERQWELLQAKCHPTAKKLARPGSSPANLRGCPTALASEKEVFHEPVYQNMLQSHATFSGALTKFHQYVAGNDVFVEKLWQNVAPGYVRRAGSKALDENASSRKPTKSLQSHEDHSVVNEVTAVPRMPRSNSVFSTEVCLTPDTVPELPPAPIPEPLTPSARYESKLAQCKAHEQGLEAQRLAKRASDEAKCAAHRERGKNEVEQQGSAAGLKVQAWENKSNEATHRRQQQKTADSGEFSRKQELWAQTQAEFQQQRQQEVEDHAAWTSQLHDNVLSTGRRTMELNVQDWRSKQERKASRASAKNSRKLDVFENQSASPTHAKQLQAVLARKAVHDKQFHSHVSAEIGSELAQGTTALRKVKKSPSIIEALQGRRPQSGMAPRSSAKLTWQPDMGSPSGISALSTTASDGFRSGSPAAMSPAAKGDSATEVDEVPAVGQRHCWLIMDTSLEEAAIHDATARMRRVLVVAENSPSRHASTAGQMYSRIKSRSAASISPSSKRAPSKQATVDTDNLMGSDGSSGDDELLQDIQTRSSKWFSEAAPLIAAKARKKAQEDGSNSIIGR